jgi:hypothetical protein
MAQFLQILFLALANILFFYLLIMAIPSANKNMWIKHGSITTAILLYSIIVYYVLQSAYHTEGFFFKVSPEREICLKEQVEPISTRSTGCCGKGTTGGYPARFVSKDFINPEGGWDWNRVDAFGPDASITPPTDQC